MIDKINYFWIRVYDYIPITVEEAKEKISSPAYKNSGITMSELIQWNKGTLLDEYYVCGENYTRKQAKQTVIDKYGKSIKFAKPRNGKLGQYAIVMDSEKFFYDRFYKFLPDNCICFECHKPISGKSCNFPYIDEYDLSRLGTNIKDLDLEPDEDLRFCSYDCKHKCMNKLLHLDTIEFQNREGLNYNGIYGYIYHIYNRVENKHYIGQTKYMPFFRWQEHVKDGHKGNICDLVFETITEVSVKDQKYLDNIEAWYIQQFTDKYGKDNVFNITHPHITLDSLISLYKNSKLNNLQKEIINNEKDKK